MKGTKIEVADDPEMRRVKRIASVVSEVEYKGLREKTVNTEARRQSVPHACNYYSNYRVYQLKIFGAQLVNVKYILWSCCQLAI
jgi:hypothetical protein